MRCSRSTSATITPTGVGKVDPGALFDSRRVPSTCLTEIDRDSVRVQFDVKEQ